MTLKILAKDNISTSAKGERFIQNHKAAREMDTKNDTKTPYYVYFQLVPFQHG